MAADQRTQGLPGGAQLAYTLWGEKKRMHLFRVANPRYRRVVLFFGGEVLPHPHRPGVGTPATADGSVVAGGTDAIQDESRSKLNFALHECSNGV